GHEPEEQESARRSAGRAEAPHQPVIGRVSGQRVKTLQRMADFNPAHFLWRQEGRVGVITLNRPDRRNPLTFESYAELRDQFRALADKDINRALATVADVRAIVLTGAGGNFCSGGDVHEIIGPLTKMNYQQLLDFTRMTGDLV